MRSLNGATGLHELMSLAALSGEVSQHDSLELFLDAVVRVACRLLGAREAFIVVMGDGGEATVATTGGRSADAWLASRSAHMPQWVADVAASVEPDGPEGPVLRPLGHSPQPLGLLGLFEPQPDRTDRMAAASIIGIAVDNFRIHDQARQHLARQSLLRDIGRILSAPGPLPDKLNAFLNRMHLLRKVDGCCLTLLDPVTGQLRAAGQYHLNGLTWPIDAELEASVVGRGGTVYVQDIGRGGTLFRSYLGVPLMRRQTVFGVLSLCAREPGAFSRKDLEFFTAASEHIALHLENAWLLAETQLQLHELTFLLNVSTILRREKTPADVMHQALQQCVQSVQATSGYLFVVDAPGDLALDFTCGSSSAALDGDCRIEARDVGYSEQPMQDFPATFERPGLQSLAAQSSRLLMVPLYSDRGLLGAMLVAHARPIDFGDSERRLVRTLIDAAENAIGRATVAVETQARMREEAASKAKSEFLAIMSHELRTPLTAILGFTELLAENLFGPTNDKQQEYLQEVLVSAHHLLDLINDILDLAKVESGKAELVWETIDVGDLTAGIIRSYSALANRKNIELTLDVPHPVPGLYADRRRVTQVLYNLMSNALKFTDPGGRVRLDVTLGDGWVEFHVSDTGIGIPRHEHETIFEPFAHASRPTGKVYDGTGLGLSVSRCLAELHGGTLWVSSEPGAGSTFHLFLPQGGMP